MNRETLDGLLEPRTKTTDRSQFRFFTKENVCQSVNFALNTFANLSRALLLGLLNAASPARRYLNRNPNVNVPVYDIVNAGARNRFCTANLVAHNCLGLGYGCGKVKFQAVAKILAGLDLTPQECEKTVNEFRAQNPRIVGLWRQIETGLRRTATNPEEQDFEVVLPSGRKLFYRAVSGDHGGITCLFSRNGVLQRLGVYGGLVVENCTQAVARDIFMYHCLELVKAGSPPILRVHDEVVLEVPEEEAENVRLLVNKIMSTPPEWMPDLPLGAEAIISNVYTK